MEKVRASNQNRMFFMFSEAGKFLNGDLSVRIEPLEGKANYSDLFYSKGLVAAADVLQDKTLLDEALSYFKRTLQAIWDLEFVTDQQAFDPKNPVTAVPGKILQGPFMIALGGIAFAADIPFCDQAFHAQIIVEQCENFLLIHHVQYLYRNGIYRSGHRIPYRGQTSVASR